jgi:hypothetical protein
MLWLECLHPLCRLCLKKLERKVCPLCRHDINSEIFDLSSNRLTPDIVCVSVRPRSGLGRIRTRRGQLDPVEIENLAVIMEETFENASLRKAKRAKRVKRENKKKGRWSDTVRQTYGGRYHQQHRIR